MLKQLTARQRAHYGDKRWLYRPGPKARTGERQAYVPVSGEQATRGKLGTTDQFDAPNSTVGINNRDNLQTADGWWEQSGRDTRPGDVMRIVQEGSTEELWYAVRGAPKNRPSQASRKSNWQMVFLAITPKPPISE